MTLSNYQTVDMVDPWQGMSFADAVESLLEGRQITRREWNDSATYILLAEDNHLRIHKSDTKQLHDLIVTRGDMEATDWIIV